MLVLFLFLCSMCVYAQDTGSPALSERLQQRDENLRKELNNFDITPYWGPYDVSAFDGTMEGHEIGFITQVKDAKLANPDDTKGTYRIRYSVYNLKHPRIVQALIDAHLAGVHVQIQVEAAKMKSSRYHVDNEVSAVGFQVWKDRALIQPDADLSGSWMTGVKTSSLHHNKMRLFWIGDKKVLLTGSLNPGIESMDNDECILVINNDRIFDAYNTWFQGLMKRDESGKKAGFINKPEKHSVNTFDEQQAINVMFNPSEDGFDTGARILDLIEAEEEFILISVFSLNVFGTAERNLYTALKAAADRGVLIVIITDRKQSDGNSFNEYSDMFEVALRSLGDGVIVYEVLNTAGRFNAMHLKDAVFGIRARKDKPITVVTDTANWSNAALGSCVTLIKDQVVPKRSKPSKKYPEGKLRCDRSKSTESTLFIRNNEYGVVTLRHHLTLLDKYWGQQPVQNNGDPSPEEIWSRITDTVSVRGELPFQRTTIYVQKATTPGENIELRGGDPSGGLVAFSYLNSLNPETRRAKNSFRSLSWTQGAALEWTTGDESNSNAEVHQGFGFDPQIRGQGDHWWKFAAYINGNLDEEIQFKIVQTQGALGEIPPGGWETGANHVARLGRLTKTFFRVSAVSPLGVQRSLGGTEEPHSNTALIAGLSAGILVAAVLVALIAVTAVKKHRARKATHGLTEALVE